MSPVFKIDFMILWCMAFGLIALFGKKFYYSQGLCGQAREAPRIYGQLIFEITGIVLMIVGFCQLFGCTPAR